MPTMSRVHVGVCAGGFFCILFVFFYWAIGGSGSMSQADRARVCTHMHCPECGFEVPYVETQVDKPCIHCGPSVPKLVATVGPKKNGQEPAGVGLVGTLLAALVLALAVTTTGV